MFSMVEHLADQSQEQEHHPLTEFQHDINAQINEAEQYRRRDKFEEAIELAKQIQQQMRTSVEETQVDDKSRWEITVDASLARMLISCFTSVANQSVFRTDVAATNVHRALTEVVKPYYSKGRFADEAITLTHDFQGNEVNFSVELPRDLAKLLTTAAVLFTGEEKETFLGEAQAIWQELLDSLEKDHPDQTFMSLEYQWFLFNKGSAVDIETVFTDFRAFCESTLESNPDRVATIASRLYIIGLRQGSQELKTEAEEVVAQTGNQWMIQKELKKLYGGAIREAWLGFSAQLISPKTRTELYKLLNRTAKIGHGYVRKRNEHLASRVHQDERDHSR